MKKRKYSSPFFRCQKFSIKNELLTSSSEDLVGDLWGDGDNLFDEDIDDPEYVPEETVGEDVDNDD